MGKLRTLTKNDIRHGDVLLFTPHKGDTIAEAIKFLTNGSVHHAALCYYEQDRKNDKCVIESLINKGLVINNLKEKEERTFPVYVARFKEDVSLKPVLDVATSYFNQKNHYPIPNIVILSALLLTRKFHLSTIKSKAIYDFACIVGVLLMDYIRNHSENQSSMICSQFVSQCFSDAFPKGIYDLKFDKLVVFDDEATANVIKTSLFEFANDGKGVQEYDMPINVEDAKNQFADAFITFKNSVDYTESNVTNELCGNPQLASSILKKSLDMYCLNFLGCHFSIDDTQLKNYLVTPQDLFVNTKSLSIIGMLPFENI